jgi:copper chaperone
MIEWTVPSMSCGHCVKAVTEAVQQVDAAARVQVDLAQKHVSIDSTTAPEKFRAALTAEGYAPA